MTGVQTCALPICFLKQADFKRANFKKNIIFNFTQFNERGAFYGASFDRDPTFHNLILGKESHIYFSKLNKQDAPIKLFTMRDTIVNGRMDLDDNNITTLDMKGSVIAGTLSRVQFNNITCANWETATLLKHEELKIDNIIRALEYKATEKDLYENELWRQLNNKHWFKKMICIIVCFIPCVLLLPIILPLSIIKIFITYGVKKALCIIVCCILYLLLLPISFPLSIMKLFITHKKKDTKNIKERDPNTKDINNSCIKLITEWLSLWVGKVSNNHGQSWGQGVLFTAGVWFLCFIMFYLPNPFLYDSKEDYLNMIYLIFKSGYFFSDMVTYFNPTDYKSLAEYVRTEGAWIGVKILGSIWFLLGKALIPYGIFEVVQAFRKYNKID